MVYTPATTTKPVELIAAMSMVGRTQLLPKRSRILSNLRKYMRKTIITGSALESKNRNNRAIQSHDQPQILEQSSGLGG
jgi:hypothetical protein